MINPTQADIGRGVIYHGGHPDDRRAGVLKGFNDVIAFVQYRGKRHNEPIHIVDLTWEFETTRHEPRSVEVSGVYLIGGAELTDEEQEMLRRIVKAEQENLRDLPNWSKIVNPFVAAKLPLVNSLVEKLGEPDYTKEIW